MNEYDKINNELNKIKLLYRINDGTCMSFLVTDNPKYQEYIKQKILSIDTNTIKDENIVAYDLFDNAQEGFDKFKETFKTKGNLVIVTGVQKYSEYLKEQGILANTEDFYMGYFNMPRDGLYLANKARLIFIVNQSEYDMFLSENADDFTSYASLKIDIDKMLKQDKYRNKQLEDEER